MVVNELIYDDRFFKNALALESESAAALVEILIERFAPRSVIDIGCGVGLYLKEFAVKGVDILGYDGSMAAIRGSLVGDRIIMHDLEYPLTTNRQFDLCLCIEVAEHIGTRYSETLIASLTKLAPVIFFTAATPGQGPLSIGHINEQPHDFWIRLFEASGYVFQNKLTKCVKEKMEAKDVVWWIVKNLMIFTEKSWRSKD